MHRATVSGTGLYDSGTMDDRLLLVPDEQRRYLAELLGEGDRAVVEALDAYRTHVQWARTVHQTGQVPVGQIPTFVRSDGGKRILAQTPRRLLSMAVSLMADKAIRVRESERYAPLTAIDHLTERLLDRLATRRLPFSPPDAAVVIDLAIAYPWLEQLRFALNAARLVLANDDAPAVIAALHRLDALFADEPKSLLVSKTMSYHPQIRTLLASHLARDSSVVLRADDTYGPAAVKLIEERHAEWDSVDALAFLARPAGTRASAAWWEEAKERAAGEEPFGRLVIDLLDLVSLVDLIGGTNEEHGFYHPAVVLLGEVNTIIVRGAAWSARFVDRPEVAAVLSRTVLRCSSLVQGLWGVEAMNSKIAYAAVDSLAALENEAGGPELERLLSEVQATLVLRRVGKTLEVSEPEIKSLIKQRSRSRMVHRRPSRH
jgi:hypothetical protein